MDSHYYQVLRSADQDDFYSAINDPEDGLYDVLWDLFDALVIEPAEVFDPEFRENNQFRFNIAGNTVLEFFPQREYFLKRVGPDPFVDDADSAGIHLQFLIQPTMSCLFSVGFVVWGSAERQAFRSLWRTHRALFSRFLGRTKPMLSTKMRFPGIEHASGIEAMLQQYFSVRDPKSFICFQYPFPSEKEADTAQAFMVVMAFLYHVIRAKCQDREDRTLIEYEAMRAYFSGSIPELPAPLPSVELVIAEDTE
ncbi:MAG: hypothetical protein JSU96_15450 [Acidobacteriota bacterium]|nr:MAG: hypothetical protein JSU96_15450 [Acidobacteriota bacterium]